MPVGLPCVALDQVLRGSRICASEVRLHPAFPVGVADGRRARREDQLAGHKVVVRHRVGGEMAEVAEPEGAQRIVLRLVVDFLAHVPVVTVAPDRRVLLSD